jgi:hypothetical protein
MKKLTVFDPATCCDKGICGVDADATLIEFSADMDWLQKNGVSDNRLNLAQEPAAFISDPLVMVVVPWLAKSPVGTDGLEALVHNCPDQPSPGLEQVEPARVIA